MKGLVATVLVKFAFIVKLMDPMLEVPEGRKTRNSWKRALLIGLTILLFMLIFAKFGNLSHVITAAPPQ